MEASALGIQSWLLLFARARRTAPRERTPRGNHEPMIFTPKRMATLLSGSGLMAATLLTVGGSGAAAVGATIAPVPLAKLASTVSFGAPPTTADCVAQIGIACYAP